jgi:hypothetical protein
MQRFYFDIFIGPDANLDADGHEIGNLRAAEIAAKRTAGELARDQLLKLHDAAPKGIRVEVKNEHRQHVLTVTVSLQIDQVGLMPHSSV